MEEGASCRSAPSLIEFLFGSPPRGSAWLGRDSWGVYSRWRSLTRRPRAYC